MKKKKTKPPSRVKYEQNHPVVSFRVSKEIYDELNTMREHTGYSLAEIVKKAIDKQFVDVEMAYLEGCEAGEKAFAVTYPCSVCGKTIFVNSDEEKKAIARYMNEHGWGHSDCVRKSSSE